MNILRKVFDYLSDTFLPNFVDERDFTKRAHRVFALAQQAAMQRNAPCLDTEHVLLGLLREDGSIAQHVLNHLGVDVETVERLLQNMEKPVIVQSSSSNGYSARVNLLLDFSVGESRHMGMSYIGTEHLLLGLIRLKDGIAVDILRRLKVSNDAIRKETRYVLHRTSSH